MVFSGFQVGMHVFKFAAFQVSWFSRCQASLMYYSFDSFMIQVFRFGMHIFKALAFPVSRFSMFWVGFKVVRLSCCCVGFQSFRLAFRLANV